MWKDERFGVIKIIDRRMRISIPSKPQKGIERKKITPIKP
jgi:hypothetical protein